MIKALYEHTTPKRATKYSAYIDLFSAEDVIIAAGETKIVKLGVKLDLDSLYRSWYFYPEQNNISGSWEMFLKSHYLEIALRSSLGVKGLIISNGIGIIDLDYPDEIGLIVHNPTSDVTKHDYKDRIVKLCGQSKQHPFGHFVIKKGDKVAQACLKEHKSYLLGYETETIRTGGFGSTGAI